ncbi:MAG: iron-sulfur cluster insertion protein ErpA [Actinomycetota bacterium]
MTALATDARIDITESAAARIQVLMQMEGKPDLMLRLGVSGGGCSGFQYSITLDDKVNQEDQVFERHGVKVVADETSLELLGGSVVDYVEDLVGASFQIRNPNASSTCGCGSSFSV